MVEKDTTTTTSLDSTSGSFSSQTIPTTIPTASATTTTTTTSTTVTTRRNSTANSLSSSSVDEDRKATVLFYTESAMVWIFLALYHFGTLQHTHSFSILFFTVWLSELVAVMLWGFVSAFYLHEGDRIYKALSRMGIVLFSEQNQMIGGQNWKADVTLRALEGIGSILVAAMVVARGVPGFDTFFGLIMPAAAMTGFLYGYSRFRRAER